MRVKVITKEHGEFISDKIIGMDYNQLIKLIDDTSSGKSGSLHFNFNKGKVFFTEEVLKTSVFVVVKD